MSQQFVYQMQGLRKTAPNGKEILKGIWLSYFHGAKIGIVGQNGAGKSTLLKIMAGVDTEYTGETWLDPKASVGYLAQEPELDESLDVKGNIELAVKEIRDLLNRYDEVNDKFAEEMTADEMDALIQEQADLQDRIDATNAWDLDRTLEIAMDALRVPPADAKIEHLSGGEKRRVALCKLLLAKPDLLLLDEPTNHLDAETVAWLERTLREYGGTVIVVTHDRYFLDNVTGWILELDGGKGVPFEGNYSSWLDQKLKKLAAEKKENSPFARALTREHTWMKMSLHDRINQRSERLNDFDKVVKSSSSNRERAMLKIPDGPRLGDLVVEADHLTKGFGDRLLIDDLSFLIPRGAIVGVVGPNGAGKTTLFKMITGHEEPNSGNLRLGETVRVASMDQMRSEIDPDESVWVNVSGGHDSLTVSGVEINSRAYTGAFGFTGSRQQQKAGTLSGGERNRLQLAKVLLKEGNLLLLDEPSNDLDITTLRALEDALIDFPGSVIVISHDRWFLDRIATHILAFEGDSSVEWFHGNYQDYERDRKKRLGNDADQPTRIKYKPLQR